MFLRQQRMKNNMALTEIALFKSQTNDSVVSEDCSFAVHLSRRI